MRTKDASERRTSMHVEDCVKITNEQTCWCCWWGFCGKQKKSPPHLDPLHHDFLSRFKSFCCFSVFGLNLMKNRCGVSENSINFNFLAPQNSLCHRQSEPKSGNWLQQWKIDANQKFFCPFSKSGKFSFLLFRLSKDFFVKRRRVQSKLQLIMDSVSKPAVVDAVARRDGWVFDGWRWVPDCHEKKLWFISTQKLEYLLKKYSVSRDKGCELLRYGN
jgi:hypothetical protein